MSTALYIDVCHAKRAQEPGSRLGWHHGRAGRGAAAAGVGHGGWALACAFNLPSYARQGCACLEQWLCSP